MKVRYILLHNIKEIRETFGFFQAMEQFFFSVPRSSPMHPTPDTILPLPSSSPRSPQIPLLRASLLILTIFFWSQFWGKLAIEGSLLPRFIFPNGSCSNISISLGHRNCHQSPPVASLHHRPQSCSSSCAPPLEPLSR